MTDEKKLRVMERQRAKRIALEAETLPLTLKRKRFKEDPDFDEFFDLEKNSFCTENDPKRKVEASITSLVDFRLDSHVENSFSSAYLLDNEGSVDLSNTTESGGNYRLDIGYVPRIRNLNQYETF